MGRLEDSTYGCNPLQSAPPPLLPPLRTSCVLWVVCADKDSHPVWDSALFRFLSLRVKGDDRRYYINVQTDSLDPIELWQHRLFLRTPGKWETVLIPWGDFLRTRNGRISYKKFDGLDRERVKTVGASLIERKEGPFCLYVAEIKVPPLLTLLSEPLFPPLWRKYA